MASKEIISDMLEYLKRHWPKQVVDNLLKESFYKSLKDYSDSEVREAVFKYLAEAHNRTIFPKPGDISLRVVKQSSPPKYRIELGHNCSLCYKHDCMCIIEPPDYPTWTCRECYTGLTSEEISNKVKEIVSLLNKKTMR